MRKKRIQILSIIIFLFIASCKEEIDLVSEGYDKTFIVDGMITNHPGPYTVKISHSSMVNETRFVGLSDCKVTIEEKNGEKEALYEDQPGIYKTTPDGIRGTIGKSYRLIIETADGEKYQTDYQELLAPVDIDTVKAKLEYKERLYLDPFQGFQFYITTEKTDPEGSFFMWKLEETFEYTANDRIEAILRNGEITYNVDKDSLHRCWKTQEIRTFYTETSVGISNPKLKNIPLHYVDNQTKRLQYRYSLLIEQYTIDKNIYQYWSDVKSNISGDNFLDSRQPFKIIGNVYNVDNDKEAVLGHFTVASVKEKRFFFNAPRIPIKTDPCKPFEELDLFKPQSYEQDVYLIQNELGFGPGEDRCFDCRTEGGKLEPPEFWED